MLPFQMIQSFEEALESYAQVAKNAVKGMESLGQLREEDIEIGMTPKEVVYREDKVVLYRFLPTIEQPAERPKIPILIVYALINRPFMVDLQPDRSLVANLLKLGLDIYLIDWGYPNHADRWLTLDNYINGYIEQEDFFKINEKLWPIKIGQQD